MKTKFAPFAILLLLAACGQEAPPAPAAAPTQAAPAAATADAAMPAAAPAAPVGDAVFSVTPGSFRACEAANGAIAATAKWDVTSKNIKEVSIYVSAPHNERKLWLNGSAVGESTTGNWVFDQSRFEIVERGSEAPIASVVVTAVPCE